jgi:hypothetical protein
MLYRIFDIAVKSDFPLAGISACTADEADLTIETCHETAVDEQGFEWIHQCVNLHPILPSHCMQEVTHPSVAQSNIVKQVDCCSRGNSRCKYILFLVQISVQINTDTALNQATCSLFVYSLQISSPTIILFVLSRVLSQRVRHRDKPCKRTSYRAYAHWSRRAPARRPAPPQPWSR